MDIFISLPIDFYVFKLILCPFRRSSPVVSISIKTRRLFLVIFIMRREILPPLHPSLLIDTFDKGFSMGLMDYYTLADVRRFVKKCHDRKLEVWLAGSIGLEELPGLWTAGVDVICVRGVACNKGKGPGRFGEIDTALVRELVATIPCSK